MKKLLLLFILVPFINFSQVQIGSIIDGVASGDEFGYSVSLSSDGNIVAVGARRNDDIPPVSGHVRIFKNISGNWVQKGQTISGEASGDLSGVSIDLSENGNRIIIGANRNSDVNFSSGHARIFEYISGIWTQVGQDIDGEAYNDQLGKRVSMSCDGNIISVAAHSGNIDNSGYVKIFEDTNGVWTQIGQTISGESLDLLGSDISLSCDGNRIAIEALRNNGVFSGTVRVFQNVNNIWTQIGQTIDGESFGAESGSSISLSCDGSVIAVGDPNNDSNIDGSARGRTRIYNLNNGIWTQIGQDIDGENQIDNSGFSVSLSCLGDIVAIGARNNNPVPGGGIRGHVRVYKNISNSWIQIGQDIDGLDDLDLLGSSVSLSSDGSIVASGAIELDAPVPVNDISSGYVRVFSIVSELALLEVVEDILGNDNGNNITANQLNSIAGVSGAIEGVNYTTALDNGTFIDENNPTASEIQFIIDQVNASLSLIENKLLNFNLYPNPTKAKFTIELKNTAELENINIYDNLGKLVLSSKETIIDSSKLAAGLYIVEIQTNKGKASKKLIIE